jgi:hypothetical protein
MAEKHGIEEEADAGLSAKRIKAGDGAEGDLLAVGEAKVGIWEVPNIKEQEPMTFEGDVNGNEDEVEAEVMRLKKEKSIALKREADAREAALIDGAVVQAPPRSTSPPARRARRNVGSGSIKDLLEQSGETPTGTELLANRAVDSKMLQEELEAARESVKSAKEQNTLLKQLYDDASRTAVDAEQKAQRLLKENASLQSALTQGLASASRLKENRINDLELSLKQTQAQLDLLKRQNELTDSHVRRKAALWDEQEQAEEQRRKIAEQRQAKREAERRALQEALLGPGASTTRQGSPKPHDLFLAVDLADEKIDVHDMAEKEAEERRGVLDGTRYDDIDEDDELAALRREASQFEEEALVGVDFSAPRSRRSRIATAPVDSVSSTPPVLDTAEGQQLANAIFESQQQAYLAVSNDLEEELTAFTAKHDPSAIDPSSSPSYPQ